MLARSNKRGFYRFLIIVPGPSPRRGKEGRGGGYTPGSLICREKHTGERLRNWRDWLDNSRISWRWRNNGARRKHVAEQRRRRACISVDTTTNSIRLLIFAPIRNSGRGKNIKNERLELLRIPRDAFRALTRRKYFGFTTSWTTRRPDRNVDHKTAIL